MIGRISKFAKLNLKSNQRSDGNSNGGERDPQESNTECSLVNSPSKRGSSFSNRRLTAFNLLDKDLIGPIEDDFTEDFEYSFVEESAYSKGTDQVAPHLLPSKLLPRTNKQSIVWNKRHTWKQTFDDLFHTNGLVFISVVCTTYALFAEDIRLLMPKTVDEWFFIPLVAVAVYFVFEFVFFCWCKDGYVRSFLMVLDFLSMISIIIDCVILKGSTYFFDSDGATTDDFATMTEDMKAARIATRIVRMIRALRIVTSYKTIVGKSETEEDIEQIENDYISMDDLSAVERQQSKARFGSYIQELLTSKVVCMVMMLVIILPFITCESRFEEGIQNFMDDFTNRLVDCLDETTGLCTKNQRYYEFRRFIWEFSKSSNEWINDDYPSKFTTDRLCHKKNIYYTLHKFSIVGNEKLKEELFPEAHDIINFTDVETMYTIPAGISETSEKYERYQERWNMNTTTTNIRVVDGEKWYFNLVFDTTSASQASARVNIYNTLFVVVVLLIGAVVITQDTIKFVINPIRRILESVQKLQHDPFYIAESMNEEQKETNNMGASKTHIMDDSMGSDGEDTEAAIDKQWNDAAPEFEIQLLEDTVKQVSRLVALGFGRAGWSIIRATMLKKNFTGINRAGSKMHGIFLFTDIRRFTDITECLGKDVITFVNDVAAIVHGTVNEFSGATNKNIGDAFFSVWTLPRSYTVSERSIRVCAKNENYTFNDQPTPIEISDLTNRALVCAIKIHVKIMKSHKLAEYRINDSILARFNSGFRVKLGVGLHVGWAIEGAIGSTHKIDATYLSPHVQLSEFLETKTKLYKVHILLSGDFVRLLPKESYKFLRPVDHVTLKQCKNKQNLYTIDFPETINKAPSTLNITPTTKKTTKEILKEWRLNFSDSIQLFETDPDLLYIQEHIISLSEFRSVYMEGFESYVKGNWDKAVEQFTKALEIKTDDGVSVELLRFMKLSDNIPPENWTTTGRFLIH